jgi:hypothetical protein
VMAYALPNKGDEKGMNTFSQSFADVIGQTDAFVTRYGTANSIRSTVETIDYAKAKQYLATSTVNRRTTDSRVKQYAATMRENRWKLNGEAIAFDTEAHQTRLIWLPAFLKAADLS